MSDRFDGLVAEILDLRRENTWLKSRVKIYEEIIAYRDRKEGIINDGSR